MHLVKVIFDFPIALLLVGNYEFLIHSRFSLKTFIFSALVRAPIIHNIPLEWSDVDYSSAFTVAGS